MTNFNNQLTWIQNGEPLSGGFNGSNSGVMNRPMRELLNNTKNLNERLAIIESVAFYNKDDSFFVTESNKSYRVTMDSNSLIAYLPNPSTDGYKTSIMKIGVGTLSVTPQGVEKHYLGSAAQAISNSLDPYAIISLEYVISTNTWYTVYKTGTWTLS